MTDRALRDSDRLLSQNQRVPKGSTGSSPEKQKALRGGTAAARGGTANRAKRTGPEDKYAHLRLGGNPTSANTTKSTTISKNGTVRQRAQQNTNNQFGAGAPNEMPEVIAEGPVGDPLGEDENEFNEKVQRELASSPHWLEIQETRKAIEEHVKIVQEAFGVGKFGESVDGSPGFEDTEGGSSPGSPGIEDATGRGHYHHADVPQVQMGTRANKVL